MMKNWSESKGARLEYVIAQELNLVISFQEIRGIIRSSKIVQAMLLFVTVSIIATMFSIDPTLSFYGHFERGTGLLLLLLTTFGGFLAVLYAHRHHLVRKIILFPLAVTGGMLGFFTWMGVTGFNMSVWNILGNSSGGRGNDGKLVFCRNSVNDEFLYNFVFIFYY
jgi:hypothetical protein